MGQHAKAPQFFGLLRECFDRSRIPDVAGDTDRAAAMPIPPAPTTTASGQSGRSLLPILCMKITLLTETLMQRGACVSNF
ncbi:hypothetical protein [Hydrocarboniphaga sp.]|uniref:hypothetical protein n=1 Tax=Hydrocarboniphaga sp. TaxID=2033016 RepID=UPI0026308D6E|nr:hypothetical protein [Hydrocarboniphaga sp.]